MTRKHPTVSMDKTPLEILNLVYSCITKPIVGVSFLSLKLQSDDGANYKVDTRKQRKTTTQPLFRSISRYSSFYYWTCRDGHVFYRFVLSHAERLPVLFDWISKDNWYNGNNHPITRTHSRWWLMNPVSGVGAKNKKIRYLQSIGKRKRLLEE